MKVGDRVKVIHTYERDEAWGIKENFLGTVVLVTCNDFVWVKFDLPSAYDKVNQIKKAIKGLWDIESILSGVDYYDDELKAFGFSTDQLEVQEHNLQRGDVVRVVRVSPQLSDYGVKEGDIGVVSSGGSKTPYMVLLQGNKLIIEHPDVFYLNPKDLEFAGLNISMSFGECGEKVRLDKEKFRAWLDETLQGIDVSDWHRERLVENVSNSKSYTLKEIVDMVCVLRYGCIRYEYEANWSENLKEFIVDME